MLVDYLTQMGDVLMTNAAATADDLYTLVDPTHTRLGIVLGRNDVDEDPRGMFKDAALGVDPNRVPSSAA